MMTNAFLNMPYALAHDEGKRIYSFGELLTVVKANSEQTGGAFNLFEVTCSQGFATPFHIHYAEDVAVFVLEGTLTSFWGNDKCEARAGSFLFQPRGTPHGFRVQGETPARILYFTVPAGLDRFVTEQAAASHSSRFDCTNNAARHKIEILGVLPD
jgi:quercetin dioxygenase-like cupin family protein